MLAFNFEKPIVILAPMAGLTDMPMRELVASFGVDGVVSEMLASQEWKLGRENVGVKAERGQLPQDVAYVVQIAGRDPTLMAETARYAADKGADHIDINMGCPAKKVTSGQTAGAALLREPELLLSIIEAVSRAVDIPVTVKTRLGWDQHTTHEIAQQMVDAGAQMLTIHGRTRAQKYAGEADWRAIARIRQAVKVPVIANGDIACAQSARIALEQSGADGVMIGRASTGAPWLPAQIRAKLRGSSFTPQIDIPSLASQHYEAILNCYGSALGKRHARKHLSAYFADYPLEFRSRLLQEDNPKIVQKILSNIHLEAAC